LCHSLPSEIFWTVYGLGYFGKSFSVLVSNLNYFSVDFEHMKS